MARSILRKSKANYLGNSENQEGEVISLSTLESRRSISTNDRASTISDWNTNSSSDRSVIDHDFSISPQPNNTKNNEDDVEQRKRRVCFHLADLEKKKSLGDTKFEPNKDQKKDAEAHSFAHSLLYLQKMENAASLIQNKFRKSHLQALADPETGRKSIEEEKENIADEAINQEERDQTHLFTILFIAIYSLWGVIQRCFKITFSAFGRDEDPIIGGNLLIQGQPSAPAPGMETMATQAASSAAGSVGSGVATGAAAASAAATAAAAGGVAAAAGTQIITVVAVSAAVATTVTVGGVFEGDPIRQPSGILSTCGIMLPEIHSGSFSISFEGFERDLVSREAMLLETLVVDAYNNLTRGEDQHNTGCVDQYLREMQNATLTQQYLQTATEESRSVLDTTFEAWVVCEGCPSGLPLFGTGINHNGSNRSLQSDSDGDVVRPVLDLNLIEEHLKAVVLGIVQLVESDELTAVEFTLFRVFVKSREGQGQANGEAPSIAIVNVPLMVDVDDSDGSMSVSFLAQSMCGLIDPDIHRQSFALSFEGLDRKLSDEEAALVSNTVKESYNKLSRGEDREASNCDDPFLREISSVTLTEQVLQEADDATIASTLQLVLEALVTCDGCSNDSPLFGSSIGDMIGDDSTEMFLDGRLLALNLMEDIIEEVFDLINESKLLVPFVPTSISIKSPEGPNDISLNASIPISVEYNEVDGSYGFRIPEVSSCGLFDPAFYNGSYKMSFTGFTRTFTSDEEIIVETIV